MEMQYVNNMVQRLVQHIWRTKGARDAFWMYCGSFVNNIGLFFTSVLLARVLAQSTFGAFSLALLVLGAVTEFTDFGLSAGMHRFATYYAANGQDAKLRQVLQTVWRWRIGVVALLTGGGMVSAQWLATDVFSAPESTQFLQIAFIGVGGVILLSFIITYLQATQQFLRVGIASGAKGVLRLCFVGGALLMGISNITVLMLCYFLVPWVLFFFFLPVLPKGFLKEQIDTDERRVLHKKLGRFSSWIVVWSIITAISSRIDQTIISRYLGLEDVAVYSVGMQLIVIYTYLIHAVSTVLVTKMGTATNKEELWRLVWKAYRWILPATVAIGLVIWPSQYIILFFFGEAYRASMQYYVILSFGVLGMLLAAPLSRMITVFNRTEFNAIISVVQLMLVLVLNLWFIPLYGVLGAAYVFVINIIVTQLLAFGFGLYLLHKKSLVTL